MDCNHFMITISMSNNHQVNITLMANINIWEALFYYIKIVINTFIYCYFSLQEKKISFQQLLLLSWKSCLSWFHSMFHRVYSLHVMKTPVWAIWCYELPCNAQGNMLLGFWQKMCSEKDREKLKMHQKTSSI